MPRWQVPEQHSAETEQVSPFIRHATGAQYADMFSTAVSCPGNQYGTREGSPLAPGVFEIAVTHICLRRVPRVPACALP